MEMKEGMKMAMMVIMVIMTVNLRNLNISSETLNVKNEDSLKQS